jgi:hypothetical protein
MLGAFKKLANNQRANTRRKKMNIGSCTFLND